MSRRTAKKQSPRQGEQSATVVHDKVGDASGGSGFITAAVGLFLARFLMPTEAAGDGATSMLVAGWLGLAATASYLDWRNGRSWTFDLRDAVIALMTLPIILAGIGSQFADINLRVSRNLLFEWVGLLVSLLLLRQLADRPGTRRVLATGLVSVLSAVAVYGIWQHYVWYPSTAAQFVEFERLESLASPSVEESTRLQELQRLLGVDLIASDAGSRTMLRNRLLDSTEPLGFFALANTLAGLIGVALVMAVHSISAATSRRDRMVRLACVAVLGFTLLLSKSRTAYLAVAVAIAVAIALRFGRHLPWKAISISGGVVALSVIVLLATGGLDAEVLTESLKSLSYRLEYWSATLSMLGEHGIFGVGLGNFRPEYLQFKLPGASEEILDPHNWVLEAWTTAGIVGVVGAFIAVGVGGWLALSQLLSLRTMRGANSVDGVDGVSAAAVHPKSSIDVAGRPLPAILIATALGLIWNGFPIQIDEAVLTVGTIATLIVAFGRWTWQPEHLGAGAFACACLLGMHLLVSGGFGMPAVMQTWLAVLVIFVMPASRSFVLTNSRMLVATGTVVVALIIGVTFVVRPNISRDRWLMEAQTDLYVSGNRQAAIASLERAAEADAISPEPWIQLAGVFAAERRHDEASVAVDKVVALSPQSPTLKQWASKVLVDVGEPQKALEYSQAAADDYPHGSDTRADLAERLAAVDDEGAIAEANVALDLDDKNQAAGHLDKVFSDERREALEAIANRGT